MVVITLFDKTRGDLIEKLEKLGYGVFVDGVHSGKEWFQKQYEKCPAVYIGGTLSDEDWEDPLFVVHYNGGTEIDVEGIKKWFVRFLILGETEGSSILGEKSVAQVLTVGDGFVPLGPKGMKEGDTGEEPYHFDWKELSGDLQGTVLYEITQPRVDRPYTTELVGKASHYDFFTNLFCCNTFGSKEDVMFLEEIWKYLDMEKLFGKFNLEKLYTERAEMLKWNEQPRIWRKSMREVQELLQWRFDKTKQSLGKRKGKDLTK